MINQFDFDRSLLLQRSCIFKLWEKLHRILQLKKSLLNFGFLSYVFFLLTFCHLFFFVFSNTLKINEKFPFGTILEWFTQLDTTNQFIYYILFEMYGGINVNWQSLSRKVQKKKNETTNFQVSRFFSVNLMDIMLTFALNFGI